MEEVRGIIFKGNSEGLVIVIPEELDKERIFTEVEDKISSSSRFFKGAKMKVTYRGAQLSEDDECRLKDILDEKSGAVIDSFSREDEARQSQTPETRGSTVNQRRLFFSGVDEGNCKFIRSTIRSGTRIEYDGNIVVIGDVNPGAEIIASGNVIVLGTLRGMVHAGVDGNKDAFIYSLCLKPTQIRIAEVIARRPDETDDGKICPEVAAIKEGVIVSEPV